MNDTSIGPASGGPSSNGHPSSGEKPPPLPDLPPVEAPSAGFIVQLFVIPAAVVLVVILVWLLFGKLAGGERDAMEYVRLIRGSATNWRAANRAAYELASLIQNDPKLATDHRLVGELTELLDHDLDKVENPEMTQYVALALGRFQTLEGDSASGTKVYPLTVLARALSDKYEDRIRIAAAMSLAQHAARTEGKLEEPIVITALGDAAKSPEPAIRQISVYALGFFGGSASSTLLRDHLGDADRFTRYNAASALARRGDITALGTVREMLRPADLEKVLEVPSASEKAAKVEEIVLEAVNALQKAQSAGKLELTKAMRTDLETLTHSGLVSIRNAADALLKNLQSSP